VVINQCSSATRSVTSGVPQGSILGPILFLLYTDDVDKQIQEPIKLFKFADDMKLCHIFNKQSISETAHDPLQESLISLHNWCTENCLPLNLSKCSVVHFGSTNPRLNYFIEQQQLVSHSTERDLGVIFDERVTFQPHIDNVVKRARRLAGMMFHSFQSRSAYVILPL
jgi:hypothetical protein